MNLKHIALSLLAVAFSIPSYAYDVELAITYDQQAASYTTGNLGTSPEVRINALIAATNSWYKRQAIPITLRANIITNTFDNTYPYSVLPGVTEYNLYRMSLMRSSMKLRTAYDADYRVHFTAGAPPLEFCGIAYTRRDLKDTETYSANSIVDISCGSTILAHELGHNFGLMHSQRQDPNSQGPYSYGKGYGFDFSFTTIMAYPEAFGFATRISYFSDPTKTISGFGVIGAADADSKRALTNISNSLSSTGERCRSDFLFNISSGCTPYKIKTWLVWNEGNVSKSTLATESNGVYGTVYKVEDSSPKMVNRTNVRMVMYHAQQVSGYWQPVESLRTWNFPSPLFGHAYRFIVDPSTSSYTYSMMY